MSYGRNYRMVEMTKQEELIAKKRREILEKQKTAELAKAVAAAQNEVASKSSQNSEEESKPLVTDISTKPKPVSALQTLGTNLRPKVQNTFCNDGSFLTHFKKILESAKEKEMAKQQIEKPETGETLESAGIKDEISLQSAFNEGDVSVIKPLSPTSSQIESNASNDSFENLGSNNNSNLSGTSNQKQQEQQQQQHSFHNIFTKNNTDKSQNFQSNSIQDGFTQKPQQQESNMPSVCSSIPSLMSQNTALYQPQLYQYNPNIPPPALSTLSTPAPPPPPPPPSCLPIYLIPPPEPLQLNKIPQPKELDLNAIPQPQINLDIIKVPELDTQQNQDNNEQFSLPTTVDALIKLVAENGDAYEENLRARKNDLQPSLWFLFDKDSSMYKDYRNQVCSYRQNEQPQRQQEQQSQQNQMYPNQYPCIQLQQQPINNIFVTNEQQVFQAQIQNNVNDNDDEKYDPESVCEEDSDDEYMKNIKERNLGNLKRRIEEKSAAAAAGGNHSQNSDDYDDDDDDDYYDDNSNSNSSSATAAKLMKTSPSIGIENKPLSIGGDGDGGGAASIDIINQHSPSTSSSSQFYQQSLNDQQDDQDSNSRKKKRKSRWGEKVDTTSTAVTAVVQTNFANQNKPILSAVKRTDPALLQYAKQNFGTTDLSEEDWKKCEDHFKINLLYQDMLQKRQEIDRLAKSGKFKYEYDSDEDVTGGTWEHKLRTAEMEATKAWAEALTQKSEGKHHIGDFLPPEELKKFMEKYDAKKNNRQPDLSDYKEYKLKEDNIGFQMLQKLGWKEGQGLGATGEGIVNPINKAPQRDANQGLGVASSTNIDDCDNEYDAYRKRMMLAYRFRPNPLNNPRRAYY